MSAVPLPLPTTLARPGGVDAAPSERAAPHSLLGSWSTGSAGSIGTCGSRLALTDRCSLRCTYCMPEQGVEWLAKSSILATDEIVRFAGVLASLGIVEVRLTGGEPLLRRDIVDVVRRVAAIEGVAGPLSDDDQRTQAPRACRAAARGGSCAGECLDRHAAAGPLRGVDAPRSPG